MFGLKPSKAALSALQTFKKENIKEVAELGAGLGRDTIFFGKNNINIKALDYSPTAINEINKKVKKNNLSNKISTKIFDIRKKLPFKNMSIDACFSHMLYCMALTISDLKNLNKEVLRILKPGGFNIFTVRHLGDGDYKNGTHRGEDLYENDGFIVHFFSKEKINEISEGFKILEVESFEEGKFPRRLYKVTLRKR